MSLTGQSPDTTPPGAINESLLGRIAPAEAAQLVFLAALSLGRGNVWTAIFIVFASKDDRDAEHVFGGRLRKHHVFTATTTAAALRDLAIHIVRPSDWIAVKYSEWFKRFG